MRRGFTLVELLAATALSAVLMLAVLQVIGSLGRSRAPRAGQAMPADADLVELLRHDLAQSTEIRYATSAFTLIGCADIAPGERVASHQPVTVTYSLMPLQGRSWLVRRQTARNTRSMDAPSIELVWPDVTGLEVRPSGTPVVATATAGASQPVPAAVVVRLVSSDGTLWQRELIVR